MSANAPLLEVLTVSQLTASIKKHLESYFPSLSVQGEVSNLKVQSSGHIYFTLKDAQAQISAVLFRGNAQSLARLPRDGDQVILRGELSLYAPRGNYQLIVRELSFAGLGELLLKLHQLKIQLEKRGWFDPALKKKLPKYPATIGVVTSQTGSVIQDILNVLSRRFPGFHLILNPVKVQGEGAAKEIAQAIDQFNQHRLADLLIVGRGGGSLEDLWAFNEEIVADAIFRSAIPVISAVGHETDTSIADYVADVRAPTPSAAAEMAIAEKSQQLKTLHQTRVQCDYIIKTAIAHHQKHILRFKKNPYLQSPYALLGVHFQRFDGARSDLNLAIRRFIDRYQLKLLSVNKQHRALQPTLRIEHFKRRLEQLTAHLKSIDPKQLLHRGYAILFQENTRSVILSAKDLSPAERVSILMHDGTVNASIEEIL